MRIIKKDYKSYYHENVIYREIANSQRNQKRLVLLLDRCASGRLLEIGCGTGGFLHLAESHFDVEGIDISKYAVQQLQPHFGERVRVGNVEKNSLPHNRYNVVIVYNILEHLRTPEKVVKRIYAALKPGGVMIGSVPNNQTFLGSSITRMGNFFDRTHVSTFRPEIWQRIFHNAGFSKIELFGEVNMGRKHSLYLHGAGWPYLSFNLMFVCTR